MKIPSALCAATCRRRPSRPPAGSRWTCGDRGTVKFRRSRSSQSNIRNVPAWLQSARTPRERSATIASLSHDSHSSHVAWTTRRRRHTVAALQVAAAAEVLPGERVGQGDHVPRGAAAGQLVERGELPRDLVRLVVRRLDHPRPAPGARSPRRRRRARSSCSAGRPRPGRGSCRAARAAASPRPGRRSNRPASAVRARCANEENAIWLPPPGTSTRSGC